jgi:hypothetical protein
MNDPRIQALKDAALSLHQDGESVVTKAYLLISCVTGLSTLSTDEANAVFLEVCHGNPQGAEVLRIRFASAAKRFVAETRTKQA